MKKYQHKKKDQAKEGMGKRLRSLANSPQLGDVDLGALVGSAGAGAASSRLAAAAAADVEMEKLPITTTRKTPEEPLDAPVSSASSSSSSSTTSPPKPEPKGDPEELPEEETRQIPSVEVPSLLPRGAWLRALQRGGPAAAKVTREIHRRWLHLPIREMKALFKRANLPQEVVDGVEDVVRACKQCRLWDRLPARNVAKTIIATTVPSASGLTCCSRPCSVKER